MDIELKDLCRLCAKKDDFSKDLLDECNKNVLKMIQEFVQITIQDNDNMPSKLCVNCEDKVLSFHMFVLECYKVQETLRKMYLESLESFPVKLEESMGVDFGDPSIKSEVKDELTAEDIVCAINNEATLSEFNREDFENEDHTYDDDNADDDEDDDEFDMSLAQLKKAKKPPVKRKVLTAEETEEFKKVLKESNFKVKDFVKLKCNVCEEAVKSWSGLRVHYAKSHKMKPVVYCVCGFLIRSKSVLYKHVSDHKVEIRRSRKEENSDNKQEDSKYSSLNVKDFVNFTCTVCQKQCSSWYTLRSHCERFHKIRPIVHCVCGIQLKSKSVLYKHVQDHKNPDILACDKCPRITKTLAALNKHKMRHIPKSERKFCCSSCDKIFNSKDTLKSHERSHIPIEERKIYHCGICDLKFTTRSSAASHKRVVHDKIKSYVCDLCGYACGTNGELRQHRAIHSDDKPFVCSTCSKPFKTYSNLKTHMDTHEDTSYACYVCNRVLNSRRTLRKHLLVHEDKCRHVCSYCNKAFKRRQTLKVHMYTHTGDKPLTCKWCEERFAYASTLRSHRLRCHPDKMAAASYHNYSYPLNAHNTLNTHTHNAQEPHLVMHQDYNTKNDIAANVSVSKNDAEAILDNNKV